MINKVKKTNDKSLNERQRRIYDFLLRNPVGVLATVDPNSEPHGAVIYFIIDRDFNVSFLTKSETKKYDNVTRNSHVMLVVFEPAAQTVAQLIGKAVEVKDNNKVNAIATAVFKIGQKFSSSGTLPITKLQAGDYAAFTIKPDQIRMACYARPDPEDYSKMFDSIESFELKHS